MTKHMAFISFSQLISKSSISSMWWYSIKYGGVLNQGSLMEAKEERFLKVLFHLLPDNPKNGL